MKPIFPGTITHVMSFVLIASVIICGCSADGSVREGLNNSVPVVTFKPKTYIVYRSDETVIVDGKVKENVWKRAKWTDRFIEITGDSNLKPEYETRVKLLWDQDYLYIGAVLEEKHLWATMTERNSPLYLDNALELFIDPDGDTHNYVEFQINALGTIWDLFLTKPYRDGGKGLSQWNLLNYKAAVDLDGDINNPESEDNKWSVEIALPLEAMSAVNTGKQSVEHGEQWKVNFSRAQRRLEVVDGEYQLQVNPRTDQPYGPDFYVWSPQGLENIHYPEMWGTIQFSDSLAGQKNDTFISNRDEEIKWALRQVYYKQWEFYQENGYFTDNNSELNLANIAVDDFDFDPQILTTKTMFEVFSDGFNGETIWYIRQDGKVWRE